MSMYATEAENLEDRLAQTSLGPKHEKWVGNYKTHLGCLRLLLVQCGYNKSCVCLLSKEGFAAWMDEASSFLGKFTSKRDKLVTALQAAEALEESDEPEATDEDQITT